MRLGKLALVFLGGPWNGIAPGLVNLGEKEPVQAVFGGSEDHVVAVFEEGVDLDWTSRNRRGAFRDTEDALRLGLEAFEW